MGKNLNKASQKISKNEKQQFNSLIKVLRPKVYITDSSSFKQLVQELTGNGSSTTTSPTPLELNMVENYPLIGDEVQRVHTDTSFEVSVENEATTNSSELCYTATMNEEFDQVWNQMCLDHVVLEDSMASQPLDPLWAHQNLESLLLDVEPSPFFNCYAQIDQGVSIYDYELSGLL